VREVEQCQEAGAVDAGRGIGGEPDRDLLRRAVSDDDPRPVSGLLARERALLDRAGKGPGVAVTSDTPQPDRVDALGKVLTAVPVTVPPLATASISVVTGAPVSVQCTVPPNAPVGLGVAPTVGAGGVAVGCAVWLTVGFAEGGGPPTPVD
jgi:hypothetical protein